MFVEAGLVTGQQELEFYEENAVVFYVIDTPAGDSARGDYGGQMQGVVRPMLEWQTEFKEQRRRSTA
jgi:lipopolysaccharide transport system ATP-binding protein